MVAANIVGDQDPSDDFEDTLTMWVYEEDFKGRKLTDVINETHVNEKYLPGVFLGENVVACPSLEVSAPLKSYRDGTNSGALTQVHSNLCRSSTSGHRPPPDSGRCLAILSQGNSCLHAKDMQDNCAFYHLCLRGEDIKNACGVPTA